MDLFEAHNITFLDLTGVDDQEREQVLNSLYAENANVQLPWRVPKHKVHKTDVKNTYVSPSNYQQENHKIVPQHQVYLSNQVEYDTTYVAQQEHYSSPPSTSVYAPAINYPMRQPQYVVYSTLPANYHQSYPMSPVVTTNIPNNVNFANGVVCSQPTVDISPICANYVADDVPYQSAEGYLPQPTYVLPNHQQDSLSDAGSAQKDEPSPDKNTDSTQEQNGVVQKNEEAARAPTKSWASLFSGSKTSHLSNNENGNNEHEKSSLTEAVNKQINDEEMCPIRHPMKSQFVDPNCYRMGEFLLNHSVDGRTISLQPRGLINRSNYCYINSILQALLACPPVYNLLTGLSEQNTSKEKQKATPIIDGMCRFVKEFQHLPAGLRVRRHDKNQKKDQGVSIDYDLPFEPSWMYKVLNGIRSDSFLVEGRQEDAEEFLGCLLNGLNDEMLELMKLVKSDLASNKFDTKSNDEEADKEWQVMGPKNKGGITRQIEFVKTPISNIFGGFLKSRIHRAGDHSTYNIQPFFTLQLNIEKVKTVREALEALVSKNQLEGVTSEKTNEEVEAWQQVTLEELPVILILHLKCFDFKLNGCTKIVKALEFPIDLKIDSKLLSSKPNTPKEKQYKLFAVVYHDGKEATKGHYITDAFHVGYSSWIRYDDASVRTVQEDYVLKPQGTRVPYLLFYRRSDTIRSK